MASATAIAPRPADQIWEWAGTVIAGLAWLAIIAQLFSEWRRAGPSSLAPLHVCGFLAVFLFWTAYGWHFRRPAIWIGNLVASLLQASLALLVLGK